MVNNAWTGHRFADSIEECHLGLCASVKRERNVWIVDSGASHHICCSLNWFSCYKKITSISVQMPDGSITKTEVAGDIGLNDSIILKDVLLSATV